MGEKYIKEENGKEFVYEKDSFVDRKIGEIKGGLFGLKETTDVFGEKIGEIRDGNFFSTNIGREATIKGEEGNFEERLCSFDSRPTFYPKESSSESSHGSSYGGGSSGGGGSSSCGDYDGNKEDHSYKSLLYHSYNTRDSRENFNSLSIWISKNLGTFLGTIFLLALAAGFGINQIEQNNNPKIKIEKNLKEWVQKNPERLGLPGYSGPKIKDYKIIGDEAWVIGEMRFSNAEVFPPPYTYVFYSGDNQKNWEVQYKKSGLDQGISNFSNKTSSRIEDRVKQIERIKVERQITGVPVDSGLEGKLSGYPSTKIISPPLPPPEATSWIVITGRSQKYTDDRGYQWVIGPNGNFMPLGGSFRPIAWVPGHEVWVFELSHPKKGWYTKWAPACYR